MRMGDVDMMSLEVVAVVLDEPVVIDEIDAFERLSYTSICKGGNQHAGNTCARRTSADDTKHLIGDRTAGASNSRPHGGKRNRCCSFDVIVEAQQPIPVSMHEPGCVVLGEVLPLQQNSGESANKRIDKLLHEVVV